MPHILPVCPQSLSSSSWSVPSTLQLHSHQGRAGPSSLPLFSSGIKTLPTLALQGSALPLLTAVSLPVFPSSRSCKLHRVSQGGSSMFLPNAKPFILGCLNEVEKMLGATPRGVLRDSHEWSKSLPRYPVSLCSKVTCSKLLLSLFLFLPHLAGFMWPYEVLRIKLRSAACQVSYLPAGFSPALRCSHFYVKKKKKDELWKRLLLVIAVS